MSIAFQTSASSGVPRKRPAARIRRQVNPTGSPRLGREPPRFALWGRTRTWYPYHGYAREIAFRISPFVPLIPEEVVPRTLVPRILFFLIPLLFLPLYLRLARLIYPGLSLLTRTIRPPSPLSFFREMYILILAAASVVILQIVFALIFIPRSGPTRGRQEIHWWEASVVGGLLSLGVYGVLRGFQASPSDHLFFPAAALGAAVFCWLLISGIILFSAIGRKEYPWADSNGRHPV